MNLRIRIPYRKRRSPPGPVAESSENVVSPKCADPLMSPTSQAPLLSHMVIDDLLSPTSAQPLLSPKLLDGAMSPTSTDRASLSVDMLISVHVEAFSSSDKQKGSWGSCLLDLEDNVLQLIFTMLQQEGARQGIASLRATCRRLRLLANMMSSQLQVPTEHLPVLGTTSLSSRGFLRCRTLQVRHKATSTRFPAGQAAQALLRLGCTDSAGSHFGVPSPPPPPIQFASPPDSPGGVSMGCGSVFSPRAAMSLLSPRSGRVGLLSPAASRSAPQKGKKGKKAGGLNSCLCLKGSMERERSVAGSSQPSAHRLVPSLPTSFLNQLHSLQLLYNGQGLPDLAELLAACNDLQLLQQLSIKLDTTSNVILESSRAEALKVVTIAPWFLLPPSLAELTLDVPFWEAALPHITHLIGLKSLTGDSKAHYQDLEYLRSPLSAALPRSLESLHGLHVTTYADVLKVAALTRLTDLEFQSQNWDWNDPIMGGPNSYNLALNLLTALNGLHSLSIRHERQSLYADQQSLDWMLKLDALRHVELRSFKLVPQVVMPVLKQMARLESLSLHDCVDYSYSESLEDWPRLFLHPRLKHLNLEVTGLNNTGPYVHGCLLEKSIFKCFSHDYLAQNPSPKMEQLHLGVLKGEDAIGLLAPLVCLPKLKHLSLALQDVSFQVASVLNILTQLEHIDLQLAPTPRLDPASAPQPDISTFATCLADMRKYHWRAITLPPIHLTTVKSVREAVRALQGLASFPHIDQLHASLFMDWPHGRDLDTLHRAGFKSVCDAVAGLVSLGRLNLTLHGVMPRNVHVGEPIMGFVRLQGLKEAVVHIKDQQQPHIVEMFRDAAVKLVEVGVPIVLYEPQVEAAAVKVSAVPALEEVQFVAPKLPAITC